MLCTLLCQCDCSGWCDGFYCHQCIYDQAAPLFNGGCRLCIYACQWHLERVASPMSIQQLNFQGIRNLQPTNVLPSSRINIISGANGSGKTSLLEGIHILGLGRSFRTHQLRNVIQQGASEMTLFARLDDEQDTTLGIRRLRAQRELELRIKSQKQVRLVELAEKMPLQLINPDAFRLLEGPPSGRREFLDWGVFHVKHEFFSTWKRARRALKHRNALLRRGRIQVEELDVWEKELAASTSLTRKMESTPVTPSTKPTVLMTEKLRAKTCTEFSLSTCTRPIATTLSLLEFST